MIVDQKICYMFNKFFSSFIKELKALDEGLKATIKKNFKVIDKSSEEYYTLFWGSVKEHLKTFVEGENLSSNEAIQALEIVQGITIGDAVKVLKDSDLHTFWNYVNILVIFAYLYTEAKASSAAAAASAGEQETPDVESATSSIYLLFVKVVKILSMIQNSQDPAVELEDIIDDDIKQLLLKIKVFEATNEDIKIDEPTAASASADFLQSIENSKIADLAKEISKEIDISNISIEKPEDVAKLMDFSGSNNFLGNIVSKVSNKLTEKISTGEIKQEDLLSEAMSMMSMLNGGAAGGAGGVADLLKNMGGLGGLSSMLGNPMMSEMMKMAKKGKVATKNTGGTRRSANGASSSMSTRDRLRKKLDEKKQRSQDGDKQ